MVAARNTAQHPAGQISEQSLYLRDRERAAFQRPDGAPNSPPFRDPTPIADRGGSFRMIDRVGPGLTTMMMNEVFGGNMDFDRGHYDHFRQSRFMCS